MYKDVDIYKDTEKNKGATVVGLSVAPDIMAVIFLTSTTA
jgi:hypothetical protein